MKKAKIMLSAIGLLSLIGGMLAFKAQHRDGGWKCGTTSTYCTISTYTTIAGVTNAYCTLLDAPVTSCVPKRAVINP